MNRMSNCEKETGISVYLLIQETGRRCKLVEILGFECKNTSGGLFASEAALDGVLNQFGAGLDIKLFFHLGLVKFNCSC
jgi:hypothetical protein